MALATAANAEDRAEAAGRREAEARRALEELKVCAHLVLPPCAPGRTTRADGWLQPNRIAGRCACPAVRHAGSGERRAAVRGAACPISTG